MILLASALLGCSTRTAMLADLQGSRLVFVKDGLLIAPSGSCATLATAVTATLNGAPMRRERDGGMEWGSSPDGLTPMRVCREPLFVAGSRPTGTVTLELRDGITTWTMTVDEVELPKTITPVGPATSGGTLQLDTTPPGASWTVDFTHTSNTLRLDTKRYPGDDLTQCLLAVTDRSIQATPGPDPYGSMVAVADVRPGRITLHLPKVTCAGPFEMTFFGGVNQPIRQCPPGLTCSSWEEAQVRVPVSWIP